MMRHNNKHVPDYLDIDPRPFFAFVFVLLIEAWAWVSSTRIIL